MSPQAATCKGSRPTLQYLQQPSGNPVERADCRVGVLGLAPRHWSSTPLKLRSAPSQWDEKADHRITAKLLLIDDDPTPVLEHLRRAFPVPTHRVQVAGADNAVLEHIRTNSPDVIVLDLGLSDQSGLEFLQQIRRINAGIPVIVVTSSKGADTAIEAMKQGAYDCLFKPLDLPLLLRVVNEALDVARHLRQPSAAVETGTALDAADAIVGACPAMGEVYKAIGRVAAHDVPVLITGESGTGKELVARAIYKHGPRAEAPFLALNCAAIPENLLESELFGHEKGAFTGADRRRIGKFEQCHGGTLFLDEIGDMPPALQGKILRLLQEQSFERVGGNETIRADVRLIAASHRDLKTWSAEGKFRPDLFYRLGVFTIHLPPLRERGDDLPLLVQHFLRRFSHELGRAARHIAPAALEQLRHYAWPGNIRELQSVLKQALLQASGAVLLPAFLPESLGNPSEQRKIQEPRTNFQAPGNDNLVLGSWNLDFSLKRLGPNIRDLYTDTHRQVDRLLLPRVLEYTRGSQHQAALLLGIARQTLRLKLRELGLFARPPAEAEEVPG
ncbi:MAG TPA: sigma-54 dependent transcriptional regulator [Gemmataceae bacterium]|nr:sigma-54 dependent transcriptional regulator [Gemmataceae bacterium]